MFYLILTIIITILLSAFCSALETTLLNTTPEEIDALKRKSKSRGNMLAHAANNIDETIFSIHAANAIFTIFGATLAGAQFALIYGRVGASTCIFPVLLTALLLFFAGILPRNLGVICRPALQPLLAIPLHYIRIIMLPLTRYSLWFSGKISLRSRKHETSDDDILLLAEKGRKSGIISSQERDLIANTLSLDDITIDKIMTPRTVVMALEGSMTVREAFERNPTLNFSRRPVYNDTIDNIIGVVRRRDILTAMAGDKHDSKVGDFVHPAVFVPENGSALAVMRQLIKKHQQMGIVVDEFASLTGVVTLEDIFEHLLGSEIFETDDIAVDMRELARTKSKKKS